MMFLGIIALTALIQSGRPDAVCLDLKGRQVIPLQGSQKATVLIFYLAHCPISQKLTPEINRLHKEYAPQGVKFWMIHEDLTLEAREVAKEANAFGLLPPVAIDQWRKQKRLSGAMISPEAVLYDSKKRLLYRGRINDQFYELGKMRPSVGKRDLRMAIQDLLDGKLTSLRETKAIGCILPKN